MGFCMKNMLIENRSFSKTFSMYEWKRISRVVLDGCKNELKYEKHKRKLLNLEKGALVSSVQCE